jgi:hypothetical protein
VRQLAVSPALVTSIIPQIRQNESFVGYIIGASGDVGVFKLGAASVAAAALIVLTIGVETQSRTFEEICRAEEEAIANPT